MQGSVVAPGCGVVPHWTSPMLLIVFTLGCCCLVSGQDGTVDYYSGWQVVRTSAPKSDPVDYSGWRVVRTSAPMSANTSDILNKIEANADARLLNTFVQDDDIMLDVMLKNNKNLMDIIEPSLLRNDLAALTAPLPEEQLIEDLGNHITKYVRSAEGKLSWDRYYRTSSIQQFSEDLASNNDNVELLRIGTTQEGRPIQALVISDNAKYEVKWYKNYNIRQSQRPSSKPIIMLEFGLHAREWISPAVGTYVANELSKMGSSFLQHATWVIIPLANPDGYEYSHTNDRMWRKNRRPNWRNRKCPGVDLNRNFDVEWATTGSSSNPCSEVYHGTDPMSEPESIAIKKLITRFNNIQVYMSIHSYSQVFLYPYAYTEDPAPNERELKNFATTFARHIRRKGGRSYGVQQAGIGYQSGGGSDDYAYKHGIPFAYTLELPDKGHYGFIMPETEIYGISREIWSGFKCQLGELVPEAKDFC